MSLEPAQKILLMRILTIGHSTRSIEQFLGLLKAHGVELLADIRAIPRSRRHPHFNKESLPATLAEHHVQYEHLPGLGGRRKPQPDSVNAGWRNEGFRGYADYMQTPEFARSLEELIQRARSRQVAIMCAEAVPWRCHRSLVSDALLARGVRVAHIMSESTLSAHKLTAWAKVQGTRITYPPDTLPLNLDS